MSGWPHGVGCRPNDPAMVAHGWLIAMVGPLFGHHGLGKVRNRGIMVNLRSHTTRLGVLLISVRTLSTCLSSTPPPGARPDPEASTKSTVRLMIFKGRRLNQEVRHRGDSGSRVPVHAAGRGIRNHPAKLVIKPPSLREAPNGNKVIHKIEGTDWSGRHRAVWHG